MPSGPGWPTSRAPTGAARAEVDALVDIACRTPGVLGAQIAGAGLGGCAMVLVEGGAVPDLKRRLDELFYRRQGFPSGVYICTPAAGSRVVAVES